MTKSTDDRLSLDESAALIDRLLGGEQRRPLLEFFASSCLVASRLEDDHALVAAAIPDDGPPHDFIRLWLGPVNLIRTYKDGIYAVLDSRKLPEQLVADLEREGRVEEPLSDEPYKVSAPGSIGTTLNPELVSAHWDVLWDAHRSHIAQAARAGRGQFERYHHGKLATRLKVLGREFGKV